MSCHPPVFGDNEYVFGGRNRFTVTYETVGVSNEFTFNENDFLFDWSTLIVDEDSPELETVISIDNEYLFQAGNEVYFIINGEIVEGTITNPTRSANFHNLFTLHEYFETNQVLRWLEPYEFRATMEGHSSDQGDVVITTIELLADVNEPFGVSLDTLNSVADYIPHVPFVPILNERLLRTVGQRSGGSAGNAISGGGNNPSPGGGSFGTGPWGNWAVLFGTTIAEGVNPAESDDWFDNEEIVPLFGQTHSTLRDLTAAVEIARNPFNLITGAADGEVQYNAFDDLPNWNNMDFQLLLNQGFPSSIPQGWAAGALPQLGGMFRAGEQPETIEEWIEFATDFRALMNWLLFRRDTSGNRNLDIMSPAFRDMMEWFDEFLIRNPGFIEDDPTTHTVEWNGEIPRPPPHIFVIYIQPLRRMHVNPLGHLADDTHQGYITARVMRELGGSGESGVWNHQAAVNLREFQRWMYFRERERTQHIKVFGE